jgi:hypothetical protein
MTQPTEVNANGDAGQAAFLGTTPDPITVPASTRTLTVATMHAVAQSFIDVPHALIPDKIDMVRHDVTMAQFVSFADEHGARVSFPTSTIGKSKTRWVTATLATRELHGVKVTMTLFVHPRYVTEDADKAFLTHNSECVVTG